MLATPLAVPAQQSQEDELDQYSQVEELVVTARKREESLQETPISIAAFTGEGLENRGVGDLAEIGELTPNMVFDFTAPIAAGSTAASIYIRGIGQLDWALPTDPGVGLYVDGVYIARSIGGVLDLLDLERVEVLRGPQGTLFGRNTIGGAISLTTRKPSPDELWGDVQGQIGSYGQTNISAKVNIPLGEVAALGLSLSSKNRDGYVENDAGPDLGSEESLAYRFAFRYNPSENFDLNITWDATTEEETPAPNVLIHAYETGFFAGLYNRSFGYRFDQDDFDEMNSAHVTAEETYQTALTAYNTELMAYNTALEAFNMEVADGTKEEDDPSKPVEPTAPMRTLNHPSEAGYQYVTYLRSVPGGEDFIADDVCDEMDNPARLTEPSCYNAQYVQGPFKTTSAHRSAIPFTNNATGRPLEPAGDVELSGLSANLLLGIAENIDLRLIYGQREIVDGYWARDNDHARFSILQTVNDYDHEQTTLEVQVLGVSPDERLNWIVGYYSFAEEGCHLDIVELPGSVFDSGGCIDNTSTALFGQVSYDINETFSITGGLRSTDDDKEFTADSTVGFDYGFQAANPQWEVMPGDPVLPDTPNKKSASEVDTYLALGIAASDNFNMYVSYATGFKGGGFDQRTFPPSSDVPGFDPEFATTIEFGFKTLMLNNRLRLNGAVFLTDYTDMQVLSQRSNPMTNEIGNFTQNAAEASINGAEIELLAIPADNMQLELGVGLLDASYDSIDDSVKRSSAPIQEDFKLVNTPDISLNVAWQYRFALSGSSLTPRIELNHTGEVFNNALNAELLKQPAFELINFSLLWASDAIPLTIALNLRNLTDEEYIVTGLNNLTVGTAEAVYGLPQTFGIRAKYEF